MGTVIDKTGDGNNPQEIRETTIETKLSNQWVSGR